jgi:hypothetical protein
LLSESAAGCGVDERDERENVLWKERRELDVVGRGSGGGVSVEGDVPEREVEEVAVDSPLLAPISGSGLLRGINRGLGACDGFWLATRLAAYELKTSGVENGA